MPWCATRLPATLMFAIAGLATARLTVVLTSESTPLAIGAWKFVSSDDSRGRLARASSADALAVSAGTSIRLVISEVSLALSACWIGGSLISGAMFATYRSVLDTWLAAHTPSTDTGASTQPSVIRIADTSARQRPRRPVHRAALSPWPGPCSRSSRPSARSRSSSSWSSLPAPACLSSATLACSASATSACSPSVTPACLSSAAPARSASAAPACSSSAASGCLAPGTSVAGSVTAGSLNAGAWLVSSAAAPATPVGSRLSSDNAQPSRGPVGSAFLLEGRAELGLLLAGQVGADQLGVGRGELRLAPVDHRVGAEQEERRRARSDLVAYGLDERVADADVGERAKQGARGGADRQPEQRHEEDQAEQQSPEPAAK